MTKEKRTAETILEEETEIEINGKKYTINPPTTATLIKVSELISQLPENNMEKDNDDVEKILIGTLSFAKHTGIIADIVATMVMGAKESKKKGFLIFKSKYEKLREDIMNSQPRKIDEIMGVCLQKMQVYDFFLVITFLNKINLTKPTK